MSPLDPQILSLLRANIFRDAWPAIDDWEKFPWHKGSNRKTDTWKLHSSQALAIDVFGTIYTSSAKMHIFNALARQAGLHESDQWSLFLEWLDPDNVMHEINEDQQPCPFAGPWFQWMRNITNAYAIAQATGRQAAFYLVYADSPTLPVAKMVHSAQWEAFSGIIRKGRVNIGVISFQDLLSMISEIDSENSWRELQTWVSKKIENTISKGDSQT